MTFEEIQQIIQGMLSVQRELQDSQLKLAERQNALAERQDIFMEELHELKQGMAELRTNTEANTKALEELIKAQAETNVKFERLVGYTIDRERDSLDIREEIIDLKRRVLELESQNHSD